MSGLAVGFAFAACGFFLHHRHACPIHLHVKNRNRLAHNHRQVQLDGLADFALLTGGDVGANGLRCAFHRFGRHFQSGQEPDLLAVVNQPKGVAVSFSYNVHEFFALHL
jgi:hypothetical protein